MIRLSCLALFCVFIGCHTQASLSSSEPDDASQRELLQLEYTSDLKIFRGEFLTTSTLLAGRKTSKFFYTSYPATESMGALITTSFGQIQDFIEGDPEGMPLYTNKRSSLIHWKEMPGTPYPYLVDTLGVSTPQWVLGDSAKVCGDFGICRQASAHWAGRHYRAWYLPKYDIPFGPYKFHGLPGAVYSVASDDGVVRYTLTGIGAANVAPAALEVPADASTVSFASHRDQALRYFVRKDNEGHFDMIQPSDANKLIERERFMYASEYIAQHGKKTPKQ